MKPYKNVITIMITSIIIGFAFQAVAPNFSQRGDALKEYDPIAKSLARDEGFGNNGEPTSRVAPGYPFLLSIIYRFGGGYEVMFILQIFLLAGIGVISYFITKKFLPWPFNFLAALNIIAWPYLVLYTKLILTEILFIFLFIAAIYAMLELLEKRNNKWAILAGGLLAVATLVRPVILLLPLWLVGSLLIFHIRNRAFSVRTTPPRPPFVRGGNEARSTQYRKWKFLPLTKGEIKRGSVMIIALTAFILSLAPWTIRNYIQFDAFIPIASGLQYSVSRGYETLDYTKAAPALRPGEATIKDNIIARLKNVYLFWNPGADGSNAQLLLDQNKLFGVAFLIYKIIFIVTLILAFLPFLLKFQRLNAVEPFSKNRLLFLSVILYFWAIHTMLYPYPRYTLPIMPLVIILAWTSIWFLWHKVWDTKS